MGRTGFIAIEFLLNATDVKTENLHLNFLLIYGNSVYQERLRIVSTYSKCFMTLWPTIDS